MGEELGFKAEKQNVLGELSHKFRKFSLDDELPPPPPVFQTYSTMEEVEDLPPPPPFLPRKQSEPGVPLPPPPPAISPPDYSKLSRKKSEDNSIPPKLNHVTGLNPLAELGPKGFRASPEPPSYKPVRFSPAEESPGGREGPVMKKHSSPFINSRSESYADSLPPKVAEKRIITDDIKPPGAKIPAGADIPIVRKNSGARMNPINADVPMAALNISPGKPILPVPQKENILDNKDQTDSAKKDICFKCGEKVEIGGIAALSRAYHKGCFQCSDCGKVIQARFNTKDGNPFCDVCYEENAERCNICQAIIVGDSLKSGDKFYHTQCMKCSVCGDELLGQYFTSGNAFICEKDYKASLESCSICGDTLTGSFYKMNGANVCEKDYKNQLSACGSCHKAVEGQLLKLQDKVFHPDCFNCSVCGLNLAGQPFSKDEGGQIYCTEDFQRKHAATCHGCNNPIIPAKGATSAERVKVVGKDFHPGCFNCQDCGLVFDSKISGRECYPLENIFLCKPCNLGRA